MLSVATTTNKGMYKTKYENLSFFSVSQQGSPLFGDTIQFLICAVLRQIYNCRSVKTTQERGTIWLFLPLGFDHIIIYTTTINIF